jgi:hypothetical protein
MATHGGIGRSRQARRPAPPLVDANAQTFSTGSPPATQITAGQGDRSPAMMRSALIYFKYIAKIEPD